MYMIKIPNKSIEYQRYLLWHIEQIQPYLLFSVIKVHSVFNENNYFWSSMNIDEYLNFKVYSIITIKKNYVDWFHSITRRRRILAVI